MTELRGKKDNSRRRFRGPGPRPDRSDKKHAEALKRNSDWAELPAHVQLARIDNRLGRGTGARRQRARLERKEAA